MMSVSPPGHESGRRGSRTLTTLRSHALAERPGDPYPAASRGVDPAGVEPALPARQAGVVPLDHRPRCRSVETMGVEPNAGCVRGPLAPSAHAPPFLRGKSGKPESNRRGGLMRPRWNRLQSIPRAVGPAGV